MAVPFMKLVPAAAGEISRLHYLSAPTILLRPSPQIMMKRLAVHVCVPNSQDMGWDQRTRALQGVGPPPHPFPKSSLFQ